MDVIRSITIFILSGLCEIGGGYLVWMWLKKGHGITYSVAGAAILVLYGVVAIWQTSNSGRLYATYGGIFIVMSLLWTYTIDGFKHERYIL